MSWKLMIFLLGMVILLIFAGFNYVAVSDISLGFYVFKEVPVFMGLLVAFVSGALFAVLFTIGGRSAEKRRRKASTLPFDKESRGRTGNSSSESEGEFPREGKERKALKKGRKTTPPSEVPSEEPSPEESLDSNSP